MSHRVCPELQREYIQAKRNELEAILVQRHAELAAGEEPTAIPRKHFDPEDQRCASLKGIDRSHLRRELNALRHGLTGQTVLMPWEDRQEYEAFCSEFLADLAPVGFEQRQLAQSVADCQWRLNRASAYENAILTYRAFLADQDLHDDSLVEREMAKARAFPITQQDILNISLYESRIQRKMMNARKSLKELQKDQVGQAPSPADAPPVSSRSIQATPGGPADSQPISEPRPEGAFPPAAPVTDFVFSDLETFCAPPPAPVSAAQVTSRSTEPPADLLAELENLTK